MIILEGPDGGGKSTLAQALSEALGVPRHHSGGPPKNAQEIAQRHRRVLEALRDRKPIIFDRVPAVSDPIYGPIIRGATPITHDMVLELRDALVLPIIYCRPPISVLLRVQDGHEVKEHETEEHVRGVMQHQQKIIEAYDQVMDERFLTRHWVYDFTGESGLGFDFDNLVATIKRRL